MLAPILGLYCMSKGHVGAETLNLIDWWNGAYLFLNEQPKKRDTQNNKHEWVLCARPILNNWTMRSPKLASCMLYANIIIFNSKVGCLINNWL